MDLRITTTHGLVGINIAPRKMNIDYGESNFNMETKHPQIDINITHPKVNIDQSKPLAEIGLIKNSDLIKNSANKGKQAVLRGTAKTVRQGNELAKIEPGNKTIARQAKYNAFEQNKKEVNIGFIPKSRPKITLEKGNVDISLEKGQVSIQNSSRKVSVNFRRSQVEVYLKQKPSIEIQYIGKNLDVNI